jgi:hypothetical protein|tara:strand:+ start:503 stop:703 length:201 start_codon:yes stop_codon:yes gene_type:complete
MRKQDYCNVITNWEMDNWISQSQAGRLRHWVKNKDNIVHDKSYSEFFKELREAHEHHVQEVLNNAE